ncbi:Sec23/Sec24 trunk domain-containing protein [Umbelopsis sp. PMI_123]|nr:Sec23/Sec24 trunk domain-containing protein [Umbelopsis sp. PMI_123]
MNYPPQPPYGRQYGTSTPPIPSHPQQFTAPIPRAASAAPHLGPSTPQSGLKPPLPQQGMPLRQPSPGPFPPGRQASPNLMQRTSSPNPPAMHRARRHYPTAQLQHQQTSTSPPPQFFSPVAPVAAPQSNGFSNASPTAQSPTPTVPYNPNANQPYNAAMQGMANLSMNGGGANPVHVPLIGQPPQIQDLFASPPSIVLPPNSSVTAAPTVQCHPRLKRCTLNHIPNTDGLLRKSKLPLAIVLNEYPSDRSGDMDIPLVDDTNVTRCKRCMAYINPFVTFLSSGQWRCNMCGMDNDVPQSFDYDYGKQQQVDRWTRPELNYGCVEYLAPTDYMVRAPQPPVFLFVIDVSAPAVKSGAVLASIEGIIASIDKIPNETERTKIGFIAVDQAVHFYTLIDNEPTMLTVSDFEDMYLPRPTSDLVVNLQEARTVVDDLLERMKSMHINNTSVSCALGPALQAAYKLVSPTGGKIVCMQSTLPTRGDGSLTVREDPKLYGTNKESSLLQPGNAFYKTLAKDCTKSHICVDMFLFGQQYSDVATMNVVPHYTGGKTYYYPTFNGNNAVMAKKVKEEIVTLLSEKIGMEAVMRTRTSPGLICREFHGHFTVRQPDIMALPNVPRDQSYVVEIGIEEEIKSPIVCIQTALLFTTCDGERRLRVITIALPVTNSISQVFTSADQVAISHVIAQQAMNKAATTKISNGVDHISDSIINISKAYAKEIMVAGASNANSLSICDNLKLLPLLCLGLIKNDAFRQNSNVSSDKRAISMIRLRTLPTDRFVPYLYPQFYSLHNMPQEVGSTDENGQFIMPPALNLSSEKLERYGAYLLENGQDMFLWLGKDVVPQLCMDLLGAPNIEAVKTGLVTDLPELSNPFSALVSKLIAHIRSSRRGAEYLALHIVKEEGDQGLRGQFLSLLLEDRLLSAPNIAGMHQENANAGMSYYQWLGFIRAKCQKS